MKKIILTLVLASTLFTACNDEFIDPTKPTDTKVWTTRSGLIGATNGLQKIWTDGGASVLYTSIAANGLTAKELRVLNAGNINEYLLETGGSQVTATNAVTKNLWSYCMVLNSESQKVLDNINTMTIANEKSSVFVHASIFKALALGTLIQFYEKIPLETTQNATFSSRADVLAKAIATLKNTEPYLASANGFTGLVTGINYSNTVNALLARFYLMSGDNDKALAHANLVNLTVKSVFNFDSQVNNPIAFSSIIGNNNFQPINRSLGLPTALAPATADGRINFYINGDAAPKALGFFDTTTKSIPVYLPGEILLIKAEAYARKNMFTESKTELDKVLTKTVSTDVFGIGANLPAYSGAMDQASLLDEIYKNRCIELFMSGLKLEDTRRFNHPAERNRTWYPYPDSERLNNTNTPADPTN